VFAAASTKEAIEQVARDFQGDNSTPVEVSLGPSSGLAKQIEQGASADLFLSADQASADYLAAKQLVSARRNLLTNRLVVVVPTAFDVGVRELRDLADPRIRRLALAEPKVPAGEYARQALRKAGVWGKVEDRVVGGIDVRATLQFVARGEAEAGLVYRTDALGQTRVRVAVEVEPGLHDPIHYPLVLLRREPVKQAARRFYDYLGSEKAAGVFERAGFGVER
jgi:molybdate transport system substrate-binding protein